MSEQRDAEQDSYECPHDLAERETACADGMCPICLAYRLAALREREARPLGQDDLLYLHPAHPPAPQPAQEPVADEEREMLKLIDQRDRAEEYADKLADVVAALLGVEIGEHSSGNNPWQAALDAYDERPPASPPSPTLERVREALLMTEDFLKYCGEEANEAGLVDRVREALALLEQARER